MKNKRLLFGLLTLLLVNVFLSCEKDELRTIEYPIDSFDPVPVEKMHDQAVFMHYMPWFETKESNDGTWGSHWTMVNQNPDIIDADSKDASNQFFRVRSSAECSAALSRKCDETSTLSSNQSS